jgi:hypothetical protein
MLCWQYRVMLAASSDDSLSYNFQYLQFVVCSICTPLGNNT